LSDLFEAPIEEVARAVQERAKANWLFSIALGRYVGLRALLFDKRPDPVSVNRISDLSSPRRFFRQAVSVHCSATFDPREGTSDPDNSCPATKPESAFDLDAAGSSSFPWCI
jgi:hypothetical protein